MSRLFLTLNIFSTHSNALEITFMTSAGLSFVCALHKHVTIVIEKLYVIHI